MANSRPLDCPVRNHKSRRNFGRFTNLRRHHKSRPRRPKSDSNSLICRPDSASASSRAAPSSRPPAATEPIELASKRRTPAVDPFLHFKSSYEAILQMFFLKKDLPSLAIVALVASVAALIGAKCAAQQPAQKS